MGDVSIYITTAYPENIIYQVSCTVEYSCISLDESVSRKSNEIRLSSGNSSERWSFNYGAKIMELTRFFFICFLFSLTLGI
jgi:hypothetical protein